MPPRYKFTREEIAAAALEITREEGIEAVTARAVAAKLGASSKVIFGSFENMEELTGEVLKAAYGYNSSYMFSAMKEGKYPPYKAGGMAYIQFARDEKELFKLLYMRDRSGEAVSDAEERERVRPIIELIMKNTGLSYGEAYMLHIEMWVFVHGIATMIATSYLDWDEEFISRTLTDCYMGLKTRFCGEEMENGSNKN